MGRITEYKIKKLFEVRDYRFKELVELYYHPDPKTFHKWLEYYEIRIPLDGIYIKIKQVELIGQKLGFPYLIYDIDCDLSGDKRVLHKPFLVRPYKFKELAALYDKHPNTFRRWLEPFKHKIGELVGGYYMIHQIEIIIECIDLPYTVTDGGSDDHNPGIAA